MLFKQITEVDVEGLSKEEAEKKIKRAKRMNKIKAYSEVAIMVGLSAVIPVAVGYAIKSGKKEEKTLADADRDALLELGAQPSYSGNVIMTRPEEGSWYLLRNEEVSMEDILNQLTAGDDLINE